MEHLCEKCKFGMVREEVQDVTNDSYIRTKCLYLEDNPETITNTVIKCSRFIKHDIYENN